MNSVAAPVNPADIRFICDLMLRRSAIRLDDAKDYLIDMRLAPVAKEHGLPDVAALIEKARRGNSDLEMRIIEALATHETSFFRDLQPFDALKTSVLPRLQTARAANRSLTIWCAACSSGQEPYSVAMTILEHFPQLASWPVRIVATDLSMQEINRARKGRFSQLEVNRGLPATLLVKYFEKAGTQWALKPDVLKLVEFRQINLLESWALIPRADIVLLRNVLIYFDLPVKASILKRIREWMAPDGVLFLGSAETTLNVDNGWERVEDSKAIYFRPTS